MLEKRKILAKNPLEGLFGKSSFEKGYLAKTIDIQLYFGKGLFGLLKGYLVLAFWPGAIWFFEGLFGQGLFGMTSH